MESFEAFQKRRDKQRRRMALIKKLMIFASGALVVVPTVIVTTRRPVVELTKLYHENQTLNYEINIVDNDKSIVNGEIYVTLSAAFETYHQTIAIDYDLENQYYASSFENLQIGREYKLSVQADYGFGKGTIFSRNYRLDTNISAGITKIVQDQARNYVEFYFSDPGRTLVDNTFYLSIKAPGNDEIIAQYLVDDVTRTYEGFYDFYLTNFESGNIEVSLFTYNGSYRVVHAKRTAKVNEDIFVEAYFDRMGDSTVISIMIIDNFKKITDDYFKISLYKNGELDTTLVPDAFKDSYDSKNVMYLSAEVLGLEYNTEYTLVLQGYLENRYQELYQTTFSFSDVIEGVITNFTQTYFDVHAEYIVRDPAHLIPDLTFFVEFIEETDDPSASPIVQLVPVTYSDYEAEYYGMNDFTITDTARKLTLNTFYSVNPVDLSAPALIIPPEDRVLLDSKTLDVDVMPTATMAVMPADTGMLSLLVDIYDPFAVIVIPPTGGAIEYTIYHTIDDGNPIVYPTNVSNPEYQFDETLGAVHKFEIYVETIYGTHKAGEFIYTPGSTTP